MSTPPHGFGAPPPHPAPPLVGRDRELATLREHLAVALAGRGGLVLLGGEAGIGKTTLAEALCAEAERQGAMVLVGRCYDLSETPPYGPWIELFEPPPAAHDRASLPAPLGGGAPAGSQGALLAAVRASLAALAGRQPLVLLLDDLHWADPASLDLLRVVGRQLAALPLLLLATYRADELDRQHPLYALLPLLVREARAERVDLRPMDGNAVRALVAGRYALPAGEAARLVAHLVAHAEGNALYLGELLRALEEEGLLRASDDGWALGDLARRPVPPLLRQVIDGRMGRLGEEVEGLLAIAAVLGQEVPLALWRAVSGVPAEVLADTIERALAARLITEAPGGQGVRFTHALVREALYEGLPLPRRQLWHRLAGEALLAAAGTDPDTVAHHFRRAGDARAALWLVQAGDRARRAYAWQTAVERYTAALALMAASGAEPAERGWLLVRLGLVLTYSDPPQGLIRLEQAADLAGATQDPTLAAAIALTRGMLRMNAGDMRRSLVDFEAGLQVVEALPAAERARLREMESALDADSLRAEIILWLALSGRYREVLGQDIGWLAHTATPREGRSPPAHARAVASFGLAIACTVLGRADDAERLYAVARDACGRAGDPGVAAAIAMSELQALTLPHRADHPPGRQRVAVRAEDAFRRASTILDIPAGLAPLPRLPLLFLEGHWAEVRRLATAGFAIQGMVGIRQFAASVLGPMACAEGDLDLAGSLVSAWLPPPASDPDDAQALNVFFALILQRVAIARALAAGDVAVAHAWLVAHDRWLAWSGAVLGQAEGQLAWAQYHLTRGDLGAARDRATAALTAATAPRQPLVLLATHRTLGELGTDDGRHADASAHLDAALALATACAAPYERALTLLALAELRGAMGDRDGARAALAAARTILAPLGAHPALARAQLLAAALTPAQPAGAYPAGLTAREAEVLRLVAEGLTDPQIAARLVVSRNTVNAHLRAIYGKLGVATRSAATRFALQQGLA